MYSPDIAPVGNAMFAKSGKKMKQQRKKRQRIKQKLSRTDANLLEIKIYNTNNSNSSIYTNNQKKLCLIIKLDSEKFHDMG